MMEKSAKGTPVIGLEGLALDGLNDCPMPRVRCLPRPNGVRPPEGPARMEESGIDSSTKASVAPEDSTLMDLGNIVIHRLYVNLWSK